MKMYYSIENEYDIIDDNKIITLEIKVTLNKAYMVITIKNILRLLSNDDLVLYLNSTR